MAWDSDQILVILLVRYYPTRFFLAKNHGNSSDQTGLNPHRSGGTLDRGRDGHGVWAAKLGRSGGFKDFNFCI